jgi:hypothetical protein
LQPDISDLKKLLCDCGKIFLLENNNIVELLNA